MWEITVWLSGLHTPGLGLLTFPARLTLVLLVNNPPTTIYLQWSGVIDGEEGTIIQTIHTYRWPWDSWARNRDTVYNFTLFIQSSSPLLPLFLYTSLLNRIELINISNNTFIVDCFVHLVMKQELCCHYILSTTTYNLLWPGIIYSLWYGLKNNWLGEKR